MSENRRCFLKQNAGLGIGIFLQGAMGSCSSGRVGSDSRNEPYTSLSGFGGMPLKQLADTYRSDLFDHFLPNMKALAVDHEVGGFMLSVDISTREQLSPNKRAWWEGRGIWTYSFLYNNIEKNPEYLEIAQKSRHFILKHRPSDESFWVAAYSRDGSPISGPGDIFGNLYIAEGLVQYSIATGEKNDFELAKEILYSSLARYDSPDYRFSEKSIKGSRLLNHWMVMLGICTQMLEFEHDSKIELIASRCVSAIMKHHLNSEYNLLNEVISHDLSQISGNEAGQVVNFGIGIQVLWMVLYEAVRKKDPDLFKQAHDLFKRHVNTARDNVYGGYYWILNDVNNNTFKLDKILSLQEEVLIGCLFLIEHTGDEWAQQCFAETYKYVREKFILPDYAFVIESGNRKLDDFSKRGIGIYHHPRHLMLNLLALNRIISRKGKVSHIFG